MKRIDSFPHPVKHLENVWIPMPDGIRLAARIWMPENAEREPVPAILEYIPYRKRDVTRDEDALNHPYFAGHGYAAVRVDLRGSGDSEGVLQDEYLPAGAAGRHRGAALAGGSALVRRPGGDDRHLLGRLQRPADRRPATRLSSRR